MERLDLTFPPITKSAHSTLYLNLGRAYVAGGEKKLPLPHLITG